MTKPFVVNVSSIKSFMRCRWRWVATWCENRVPVGGKRALDFGKLLHIIFEEHFKTGRPLSEIVDQQFKVLGDTFNKNLSGAQHQTAIDLLSDLSDYGPQIADWRDEYPLGAALEIEEAYSYPHPLDDSIHLLMRPDRVAPVWGKLFHWQNRGLQSGMNFATYCELAQRDMHEHVYKVGLQQKYPDIPYGGTGMNLIRKLKHKGKPTKKEPLGKILHPTSELRWQGLVALDNRVTAHMMKCVLYWAKEMRETKRRWQEDGEWPAPNEDANGGFSGKKPDPYFGVLVGNTRLDDNRHFEPREDPYAASPA